ncbi:MAG: TatD family hydrolase [Niabella sp.]
MFIDTHSHIYSEQFKDDSKGMLERSASAGVTTILMPAIDADTHIAMLQMENSTIVDCISMMGLHPCSVNDSLMSELKIAEEYLKQRPFIAIGETGLDFYWDTTYKKQQYEAFEQQIEWAIQYDIPIVIHSRESTNECIDVIKPYTPKGLKGVFHCFGGSVEQAKAIIDNGFYLGIGGVLTFKKSGLDLVLKQIPLEHIILETDAPYLAPVPYRGKRNEPAYIPFIAQKLADIQQISIEEIAGITTKNAENLFKL